tara:strand:+ start:1841 stop:2383 length:543 start_codon:yes stop_codon:yes gene_type:complete
MSHIGKLPIEIPEGVEVNISNGLVVVKGKLGELSQAIDKDISVKKEENLLVVSRPSDNKKHRELHGLTRALVNNLILGVSQGFSKELHLVGVGFTAESNNDFLIINLGYSHPIYFESLSGIDFEVPNATTIIVKGIDKQLVGQVAAKIRDLRKPEPYKGKGVKYSDEIIRRKAGKTVGVG